MPQESDDANALPDSESEEELLDLSKSIIEKSKGVKPNQVVIPDPPIKDAPPHITDKANDILNNKEPVKFIFDTHQTLHTGDEKLTDIMIVATGCQSANNTKGIQPKASGGSGKGKSHSEKAFAHLIPKEYLIAGSISDKVLYYTHMKPGTIIYSDDIKFSEDLESTIKRSTTNFQIPTKHHTLDKDRIRFQMKYLPVLCGY